MLKISSILEFIKKGLKERSERFVILDDEHVMDNETGVELHLFDKNFKITHGDKVVLTTNDLATQEQDIVMAIKEIITSPEKSKELRGKYFNETRLRREEFSSLFEDPRKPISDKLIEDDTDEYLG